MKICHISDTHTKHGLIPEIEPCDILIHSGDFTNKGEWYHTVNFLTWFNKQPARYKIFIAGNHDFNFDLSYSKHKKTTYHNPIPYTQEDINNYLSEFPDIIYLNDSGITIEGLNIWGSPVTPFFYDWAFNRERGGEIKQHWGLIPNNTNVLIVHGPPKGYGDYVVQGNQNVGCEDLLERIKELKELKLACYGHIHSGHGKYVLKHEDKTVTLSNGSVLDEDYMLVYDPLYYNL